MRRSMILMTVVVALATVLPLGGGPPIPAEPLAVAQSATPTPAHPRAVIEGPATIEPGGVAVFDTPGSLGLAYVWEVFPEAARKSFVARTVLTPEGRAEPFAIFSAPGYSGPVYVVLIAVGREEIAVARHTLTVGRRPKPNPPPGPTPGPQPQVQAIWCIVVEPTRRRTVELEQSEQAIHAYADQKQSGRWKRLDASGQDETGRVPAGFARFLEDFSRGDGNARLYVVSHASGATLWSGPVPQPADKALALVKKYGG